MKFRSGISAYIRASIECPLMDNSFCFKGSLNPAAAYIDYLQSESINESYVKLPLDQILTSNHFGYWMLHLKPCVHFHEIK